MFHSLRGSLRRIHPILLVETGSAGLWPLVRDTRPKAFADIRSNQSPLRAVLSLVDTPQFAPPLISLPQKFGQHLARHLQSAHITDYTAVFEPTPNGSALALAAVSLEMMDIDPDRLLLILPDDRNIQNVADFHGALRAASGCAQAGEIVTFGTKLLRGEKVHGYVRITGDEDPQMSPQLTRAYKAHVEDCEAEEIRQGPSVLQTVLQTTGIFLIKAGVLVETFERLAPDLLKTARMARTLARPSPHGQLWDGKVWARAEAHDFEEAIIENLAELKAMSLAAPCQSFDSWTSVWEALPKDADGNALHGQAKALACTNSLLRSEDEGVVLVGLGLRDVVAVATPDAVLVTDKAHAADLGAFERHVPLDLPEAYLARKTAPVQEMPWGHVRPLDDGHRYAVHHRTLAPGAALEACQPLYRSEHWIVVSGTAEVHVNGTRSLVSEGQSIHLEAMSERQLCNPGKVPLVLIEIQTGGYLAEDDGLADHVPVSSMREILPSETG
ncbi:MAG: sugar phosphate nucleotidyltransferase [Pseudomonadota bacterium]